jgi:hypothetical protein
MTSDDRGIEPGSATDLAIERALEAANLRAGDATSTSNAVVVEEWQPTAAEAGEGAAGFDAD